MLNKATLFVTMFLAARGVLADVATGTGFFISDNGYIITNAHVVEGATDIAVKDNAGGKFVAQVISIDEHNDLALLKIDKNSFPLSLGSSLDVDKGDKVYTLGFPDPSIQGFEAKYTEGVISSFSGVVGMPNTYQITTPIQGGNSGGPLLNEKGVVVGVIVSKLVDVKKENVSYAIKSDYIIPLLRNVPKSNRANNIKIRSVAEIERSVVLVVSKLASPEPKNTIKAPASPDNHVAPLPPKSLPNNSDSVTSVKVTGPDIAEAGCVVPMGVTFDPPLRSGATFNVMSGSSIAATVDVTHGRLSEFQMRVRMTSSNSLTVVCDSCKVTMKSVNVINGCTADPYPSGDGRARIRINGKTVLTLIDGHYPRGVVFLKTNGGRLAVHTTEMTAKNPFFSFSFSDFFPASACIQIASTDLKLNNETCQR